MGTIFSEIDALEDIIKYEKLSDKKLADKLISLAYEICNSMHTPVMSDDSSSRAHLFLEDDKNYYLEKDGIYCDKKKLNEQEVKILFLNWVGNYGAMDCLGNLRIVANKYCGTSLVSEKSDKKQPMLPSAAQELVNKYGRKAKESKLDSILEDKSLGSDI